MSYDINTCLMILTLVTDSKVSPVNQKKTVNKENKIWV